MAFGITPSYSTSFDLGGLTPGQFISLAASIAEKMQWKIILLYDKGLIAHTGNGTFAWNAEIKMYVTGEYAMIISTSKGMGMMDWGKNRSAVDDFISEFNDLKSGISREELLSVYNRISSRFSTEDMLSYEVKNSRVKANEFFSIFIPREDFFITPLLIDINILVFLLMAVTGVNILAPDSASMLKWGANFRPSTLDGQWWRLFTCFFLHIGMLHLLMNMYALLYIGMLLEPLLGKSRFLSAYLLTGFTASTTSMLWHPLAISAGASGAIFGMYGVFLAMLTTSYIEKSTRKALLISISIFVFYNLLNGLKAGVDNAAHIGGLACGIISGYAFIPGLKDHDDQELKYRAIIYLVISFSILVVVVYRSLPNDYGKYNKLMDEFARTEKDALAADNFPPGTTREDKLYRIKNVGIYYWNENIKTLEDADKLKIPEQLHSRNDTLIRYCRLRIKCLELKYREVETGSNNDTTEFALYNRKISNIISSFHQLGDK